MNRSIASTALAPLALEMQVAYQSRHSAKQRRIKEIARAVPHLCCRRGRKCRDSSNLDTRLTNKQFGGKRRNRLRKVPTEANSARTISWQCCCFSSIEPNVGAETRRAPCFASKCSGQRNAVWNSKSTTLRGILWYSIRSSSWNRNVPPPAVFRSWCAQLKSWSNTKGCTERNVGWQTPHDGAKMRADVLNNRIVKMLTLLLVIIPKPALCDTNMLDVFGWRNKSPSPRRHCKINERAERCAGISGGEQAPN